MKRLFIFSALICILLMLLSSCSSPNKNSGYTGDPKITDNGTDNVTVDYGGDPMEFESFSLSESGTTAETHVYEGYKTADGVHLEYYISQSIWDNSISGYTETRITVRSVDGNEALYQTLCTLFGDCKIDKWANFKGSNPPNVLDGSSMSFQAVLADGTKITADGTNNFPKNFRAFSNELHKLINEVKLTNNIFSDGTYEITVPDSWIGIVSAEFSEFYTAFSVDKNDGNTLTFFIIDTNGSGYTSISYPEATDIGRLIRDDDVRFITARDHYSINDYADKVSEEALALWDTYEDDKLHIIESLHGVNGYELIPEDGSTLYEAEAMDLADRARSAWLCLNFAGEYSGGVKPTKIKGRSYLPMYPSYENITAIEDVRDRFLTVFSEEFTDRVLNAAIADKDILEYNDNVYVAYKKNKGDTSGNSYVDHIENKEDGSITVVMTVNKSSSGKHYVDLPVEKNADGKFVFSDYPYWDESE